MDLPESLLDLKQNYQIVTIDNFYDSVNDDQALEWLGKLFQFKVNSYRKSYPYGILPFGASDLVGAHWIFCHRKDGILKPIMALKTTDHKQSEVFRIDFPALSIVNEPHLAAHRKVIESEIKKANTIGHSVGYIGSWTISPECRDDKTLSKICRKMTSAFYSLWIQYYNVQTAITFASLRFHVEKFHDYMGLVRLNDHKNCALPEFKATAFFDEPACASILYRKNHSLASQNDAKDIQSLWDQRIFFGSKKSPLYIENQVNVLNSAA